MELRTQHTFDYCDDKEVPWLVTEHNNNVITIHDALQGPHLVMKMEHLEKLVVLLNATLRGSK